ncbi:MAG: hypothetical protein HFE66_05185 [Clostridiales bacterium]|jgi:type I restriction enzyme S subunit|nr:hypothetical protein [Clostridiales bacterium]
MEEIKKSVESPAIVDFPEDWEICTLSDQYTISAAGDVDPSDFSKVKTFVYQYPIYSNALQDEGIYGYCSNPKYAGNAVTITGRGDIGHCLYRREKFSAIVRLLICEPKTPICSRFVAAYLENTAPFVFESTGVPQLTVPQIQDTPIPVPPLHEQEHIAQVLEDTDALAASLEKLILKKKAIMQGTIEQLLSGKIRLHGYSDPWGTATLGDIGTLHAGGTPPSDVPEYYGGEIPWVSISDMSTANKYIETAQKFLSKEGIENSSAKIYPTGTLLFAMYASIGKCCITRGQVSSSQAILGIYNLKNYSIEFLYYVLSSQTNVFLQMGQTGTQANLSKDILQGFQVPLPSREEQDAIAAVLADMDKELEELDRKLSKYRQIQQGMLQQLLTGKIRLL